MPEGLGVKGLLTHEPLPGRRTERTQGGVGGYYARRGGMQKVHQVAPGPWPLGRPRKGTIGKCVWLLLFVISGKSNLMQKNVLEDYKTCWDRFMSSDAESKFRHTEPYGPEMCRIC